MKVRVKKTGEVLNVAEYAKVATDHCNSWGNPVEYSLDEIEIIPDEPQSSVKPSVDWGQRRYEISRDALSAHLASEEFVFRRNDYKEVAKQAICFADELIKQLKGEQQ